MHEINSNREHVSRWHNLKGQQLTFKRRHCKLGIAAGCLYSRLFGSTSRGNTRGLCNLGLSRAGPFYCTENHNAWFTYSRTVMTPCNSETMRATESHDDRCLVDSSVVDRYFGTREKVDLVSRNSYSAHCVRDK